MALRREMGVFGVFTMASGSLISSGIFVLPAIVFVGVGPGLFLSYLVAAVLLLPAVLCKAELMTAMPKAGGTFFHVDRSLGPAFGMVGGVATWASLAFKSAFALIGIGAFAAYLWPAGALTEWEIKIVACAFCVVFAGINLLGTRHASRIQSVLVTVLLAVISGYVAAGIPRLDMSRFSPLLPEGVNSVLIGAGMVFISFGGVTQVANLAEEVRNPKRDLIWGMFLAYGVVSLLYVTVAFVTTGLLPAYPAAWEFAPLSEGATLTMGRPGAVALGVAALFAYLTTGNAGILTASRALMAMSQDHLAPPWLAAVSPRRGVPVRAVLVTSGFMVACILALDLELFVKAASAMLILLLILEILAMSVMRESRLPSYQPTWRTPFYPWVHVAGLIAYAFLLVELGSLSLAVAGAILGTGIIWYVFRARERVVRESALVRLAERIAATDFREHDVEAELAGIVRDRDELIQDRFDLIVRKCPVIDTEEPMGLDECLGALSGALAPAAGLDVEELRDLLARREALSSTVVRPGVAVPHVVTDDVEQFGLALLRCRGGADFGPGVEPVTAVFAVATPMSEREFYLTALVAIAEITGREGFDEAWMAARGTEGLREVVLAAERRREPRDVEPKQADGS